MTDPRAIQTEVLYNGIRLPSTWPPRDLEWDSSDPLPVPYLDNPPEVIPIDGGRQLLVDDFLIEECSLIRSFGKPTIHPDAPVLVPESDAELDDGYSPMAAPFNDGVCYDPEAGQFKLWYMPGWFNNTTAMAVSDDGVRWERPELDVVPGTNLIWPREESYARDGCMVWRDYAADDPAKRFAMFQYYRYREGDEERSAGLLSTSPDGAHWGEPTVTTHVGDNTSFFYNPFRRKWCVSVRRSADGPIRLRHYVEMEDLIAGAAWDPDEDEVFWQRSDSGDLPDPERPDHRVVVYDVNATPYESLMLGMFAIFRGPENDIAFAEGNPKTMDLVLGYSRDGFHFSRPDRTPFLASSRRDGNWNKAYLHACGGLCCVVGDELYFYFGAFSGISDKLGPGEPPPHGRRAAKMYAGGSTGLATLRRDGFAALEAGAAGGTATTRPVTFKGDRLFVNAATARGELRVEVLEVDGRPVPGFGAGECIPLSADATAMEIAWARDANLGSVAGRPLRLRFHLESGSLYSFWVTDDPDGASYGYVAAGGPGFYAGRDLPA